MGFMFNPIIAALQQPGLINKKDRLYRSSPPIIDQGYDYVKKPQMPDFQEVYDPTANVDINKFDPSTVFNRNEDATKYAIAQSLGILSKDSSIPPLPQDQQNEVDAKIALIKKLSQPGQLETEYTNRLNEAYNAPKVSGLKSRLASGWRGMLMGEGLPGFFRGVSDPNTTNLRYKIAQLQPLAQSAQQEQQLANTTVTRNQNLAKTIGIDPLTGLETPEAASKRELSRIRQQQADAQTKRADSYEAWMQARVKDVGQKPVLEQRKQVRQMLASGNLRSQEALAWAAKILQVPVPLQARFMRGEIGVDDNFNYVDLIDGKPLTDAGGQPIVSVKKTEESNKVENAKVIAAGRPTAEERKETHGINRAKAREELLTSWNNRRLKARTEIEKQLPAPRLALPNSQEMTDWNNEVERRLQQWEQKNPAPDINKQSTAGQSNQQTITLNTKSGQKKLGVGGVFTSRDGKRYKIKAIYEDGSFDADPIK